MPSILHVVAYTLKVRIPYRPVCIHLKALMVCKHTCSHHVQPEGLTVLHLHLVSNSVIRNIASFANACMHSKPEPVWDFAYFLQLDLQLLAYNNSRYEQKKSIHDSNKPSRSHSTHVAVHRVPGTCCMGHLSLLKT